MQVVLGEVRSVVTNASANSTMIYSAKTDGNKECDLVFCTLHGTCMTNQGKIIQECYCCEPDPKIPCFATRNECKAACPFC
ncbi:hypothetical protein HU200_035831 [Digitaria exilis]|uniref:Uncharacterized protein n=1 Tax=Digitaria exilis TaxID=1010633 RepID=A0A835EKV1_9POAL|nr:hypothetical protein HU200_035831 [Digitaria exilis]